MIVILTYLLYNPYFATAPLEHCKQEVKNITYNSNDHNREFTKCILKTTIVVATIVVVFTFYFLLAMFQVS